MTCMTIWTWISNSWLIKKNVGCYKQPMFSHQMNYCFDYLGKCHNFFWVRITHKYVIIYQSLRTVAFLKVQHLFSLVFNTQYMRNPDMLYVLKMEYVSKINIFGLKMMVKSGLEKIFLKFLHAQSLFHTYWFSS